MAKPNKVVSIDQASTPATMCAGLMQHHEHIVEMFCTVVWQGGDIRTYHTKMSQADLVWLLRKASHDIEGSMFGESGGT